MHPELKAYLDDYYARTMARYDAMDRQHDALLSKLLAGVPTPQSARPMSKAADGGLTDDATVPAVLPAAFSATTQAQEAPAVAHDAPLVCIEMAPVTCLMECPTQVVTNTSVDEVHDAATTVFLEPAVDLFRQEVEQLTPVPSISTNTTSTAEVVTTVATITDIDPKAGVLELDASPLPSINTSTSVASERDHSVILSCQLPEVICTLSATFSQAAS